MKRLPRWLDRAGFEADKLMRANRVRAEAARLAQQADDKVQALGLKALELSAAGVDLNPELGALVTEINLLRAAVAGKEDEIKLINAEGWVEPSPPAPPKPVADPVAQRLQAYMETTDNGTFTCPKCATVIRATATFCPRCGRKILR